LLGLGCSNIGDVSKDDIVMPHDFVRKLGGLR
jgi:hypothetical protein